MYEFGMVINIAILYDYDRVFEKHLSNYIKLFSPFIETIIQVELIRILLKYESKKCISVFGKKYGYGLLYIWS